MARYSSFDISPADLRLALDEVFARHHHESERAHVLVSTTLSTLRFSATILALALTSAPFSIIPYGFRERAEVNCAPVGAA